MMRGPNYTTMPSPPFNNGHQFAMNKPPNTNNITAVSYPNASAGAPRASEAATAALRSLNSSVDSSSCLSRTVMPFETNLPALVGSPGYLAGHPSLWAYATNSDDSAESQHLPNAVQKPNYVVPQGLTQSFSGSTTCDPAVQQHSDKQSASSSSLQTYHGQSDCGSDRSTAVTPPSHAGQSPARLSQGKGQASQPIAARETGSGASTVTETPSAGGNRTARSGKRRNPLLSTLLDWTDFCPDPSDTFGTSAAPSTARTSYASSVATTTDALTGRAREAPFPNNADNNKLTPKELKDIIRVAKSRPLFRSDGGFSMLDRCVVLAQDGALGAWTGFTWKQRRALAGWNVAKISHDTNGYLWSLNDAGELARLTLTGWNSVGLVGNRELKDVVFDPFRRLWGVSRQGDIATWNGYTWSDQEVGRFKKAMAICCDRLGNIWVLSSSYEIAKWDTEVQEWDMKVLPAGLKPRTIAFDASNCLWGLSGDGQLAQVSGNQWIFLGHVAGWRCADISFRWT